MTQPLDFDPFDPEQTHAMWNVTQRFQREAPVARLVNGFIFVTRYEDVRHVLRTNAIFANAGGSRPNGLFVPLEDRTLGELDPPEHGPIRRLAMGAVSSPAIVESLRDFTRDTCRALLVAILQQGRGDLVGNFSVTLTNRVIAKVMGVPLDRSDWLAERAEEVMRSDMPVTNRTPQGFGYAAAFPELTQFVDDLIRQRKEGAAPADDAISRIIATAGSAGAPDTTIRMVLLQLLLGGSATTRDLIGSLFHELVRHPELHDAIRMDPTLVPVAGEESLRLAPPVLFLIRTCKQPTALRGVEIHAGERVIAAIAAANRDEAMYDRPDAFRLDRKDPPPHLTFGFGAHHCVGAALARMEIEVALEIFNELVRPGQLRTAPGFEFEPMPTPFLYGPVSVDVTAVGPATP